MKRLALLLMLLCSGCIGPTSEPQSDKHENDHTAHIRRIENNLFPVYVIEGRTKPRTIYDLMDSFAVPGLSIAFVEKGKVVWQKGYGYADLEDSARVTPRTVFRGASLSKPLTAVAAIHLAERGVFDLNDDINTLLKGWLLSENTYTETQKVTLANLITHTSGVRNDYHAAVAPDSSLPALESILSGRVPGDEAEVIFVPGTRRKYSNVGYMLISEALADATDKPFDQVMEEVIIDPLGLHNTTFRQNLPDSLLARTATGYEDMSPISYYHHPSYGAGAIWTTPTDLGLFLTDILSSYKGQNGLLSAETVKAMLNAETNALGLHTFGNDEMFVFRNDGSLPGYTCFMMGCPEKEQAVVIMQNANSEAAYHFLNYLWRSVSSTYQWGIFDPQFYYQKPQLATDMVAYRGRYASEVDTLLIAIQGKQLVAMSPTRPAVVLKSVGNDTFISEEGPMKLIFHKNESGTPDSLRAWDYRGDELPPYTRER